MVQCHDHHHRATEQIEAVDECCAHSGEVGDHPFTLSLFQCLWLRHVRAYSITSSTICADHAG